MKRVLTLVAGLVLTAGLNGCCWLHGGYGGGCGGGACGAPYGAGFAPAAPGGCPNGQCGYGPVGYNGIQGQTAYATGTTMTAGLPATSFTPTVAYGQPTIAPVATAAVDPLPTF